MVFLHSLIMLAQFVYVFPGVNQSFPGSLDG